jgi:phosphoserine phosphatase RsbU/P
MSFEYDPNMIMLASLAGIRIFGGSRKRSRSRDHSGDGVSPNPPDAAAAQTLRSIVQSLADALVVIDERGFIRSFSPSAEKTFGYEAAEIVGRTVSVLIPPEHRERHETAFREYVESGWASRRLERCFLTGEAHIVRPARETVAARKDGSVFPVRLVVSEIESGEERLFVALLSDLSERKRLELELARRHKQLEEAYAVIESQRQRMQDELNVGRQIQLSMVPHQFPALAEVDLWATLRPAREVGGDFYDVFRTTPSTLWFCIGDVSGKGVPAALLMAVTKTLLKSFATQGYGPGEVCTRVSAELSQGNEAAMFVTAFVASLDLQSGELRCTNAGHNPPLLQRRSGALERCSSPHGPVLGVVEQAAYGESTDKLLPGETLLLFTDGIIDALDPAERYFTEARLREVFARVRPASARDLAEEIVAAVDAFTSGAEQADDITLLVVHRNPEITLRASRRITFQVTNELSDLTRAVAQVDQFVSQWTTDVNVRRRFCLAFDELLSNIIKYAYADGERHTIECELWTDGGSLAGTIIDDGLPFNPLEQPNPYMGASLEQRPLGGLGIPLVRGTFPETRYNRIGSQNVLTLIEPTAAATDIRADSLPRS